MHFVTGGSFNGKLKWILRQYNSNNVKVIRCYEKGVVPNIGAGDQIIIITGIEYYLKTFEKNDKGRAEFNFALKSWLDWEYSLKGRKLILIGSDLGKGVVPMEKEDRQWRDFVGWCYQDIVTVAKQVDIIWYGLSTTIKH